MSNIIRIGGGGGDLEQIQITRNGTYNAADYEIDGFNICIVDVEPNTDEIILTDNGVYMASDYNVDGFDKVTVNLSRTGGLNANNLQIIRSAATIT